MSIVNIAEAQRYLSLLRLNDSDKMFEFAVFHDKDKTKHTKHYPGTLTAYEDILQEYNEDNYGVFVTINKGSRKKGSSGIQIIRAIWQEADTGAPAPTLPPSFSVETSPGKYHRYWLVQNGSEDFDGFNKIMASMVDKYGSDPNAKDLQRVLRVPGFYHNKTTPFLVHIMDSVTAETVTRYKWEDLLEFFRSDAPKQETVKQETQFNAVKAIRDIIEATNYHGSLVSLAMRYANKGMSVEEITSVIQGLFSMSTDKGTLRWQHRVDEIPKAAISAVKKIHEEDLEDPAEPLQIPTGYTVRDEKNIQMPPGNMRSVVESVMAIIRYPSLDLAIETALHAVNTFAGNYYVFDDTPNHRKTILLASQGRGKNTPSRYMNLVLNAMIRKHPASSSFIDYVGSPDYTSAQHLHRELMEWGSRSIITPEAGHAKQTTAGDIARLTAYENQLLGSSPNAIISVTRQNTQKGETRARNITHACVSLLQESVPNNYAKLLEDGKQYADGTLSRVNIIFIKEENIQDGINSEASNYVLDENVCELLYTIADNNATKGNIGNIGSIVNNLEVRCTPEVKSYLPILEAENLAKKVAAKDEYITESIYTRRTVKIKSTARLLAVADNPDDPCITMDYIRWAEDRQTILDNGLLFQTDSGLLAPAKDKFITRLVSKLMDVKTCKIRFKKMHDYIALLDQGGNRLTVEHVARNPASVHRMYAQGRSGLVFLIRDTCRRSFDELMAADPVYRYKPDMQRFQTLFKDLESLSLIRELPPRMKWDGSRVAADKAASMEYKEKLRKELGYWEVLL